MPEHTGTACAPILVAQPIRLERTRQVNQAYSLDRGIDREVERERHERALHDDERTGLGLCDELRTKDAREHVGAVNLRRPSGQ
jgi:hypothetical protein